MSRSYREPWVVDGYGTRRKALQKRAANKYVRRAKNVPSGMGYRKFWNPWNICDFKFHRPEDYDYEKIDGVWTDVLKPWNKWRRK